MPKQRLENLDLLKGFAIFLMVMGHFLSWTFAPDAKPTAGATFVRNFIYTFHMPLFFFVSGYLMHMKKEHGYDLSFCKLIIKKRLQSLILPGFSFMLLTYLRTHVVYFEWFLRTLFEIYVIFCIVKLITNFFNDSILVEVLFHLAMITLIAVCCKKLDGTLFDRAIDFHNILRGYPFFLCGFFFRKFNIERFLLRGDLLYSFCLVVFFIMFFASKQMNIIPTKYVWHFTAALGVVVCYKNAMGIKYGKENFIIKTFLKWGKYSIEIYLLSPLFIPYFPDLGNLFISSDAYIRVGPVNTPLHLTTIFLQIVTGAATTTYVCVMCLTVKKL